MKFTRIHPVLVPIGDIHKGNIFKEPNRDDIYVKINDDKIVCLNGVYMSSDKSFSGGCEVLGKTFEDFIEKLKNNEYEKKNFEYLFSDDIIFGSLFECDRGICMKIDEEGRAVCLDNGHVVWLDRDRKYRIIKNYKMEIME